MSIWAERARALEPSIAAANPAMLQDRELPAELAKEMAQAGLFRLCVPKDLGGEEVSPLDLLAALEALGEIDASPAWCAMIAATTGALGAYMEPAAAREIFGAPDAMVTGVYAPSGKASLEGESFRVRGRWAWNSGGGASDWIAGGCLVMEGDAPRKTASGAPEARMIFFRRSEVTRHDTWHTTGLRGTGSGDMSIDGRAPRARSVSLVDDAPRVAGALYAFPAFGLLALGIASVASGNVSAALREFREIAAGKRLPNGRTLADRGAIQALFAQCSAEHAAARALLLDETGAAWAEAQGGGAISLQRRASLRLSCTHMTRTAADVARRLQDYAGGGAVFSGHPLHRRCADAQTMTAHIMIAPPTYELVGRVLLGGASSIAEL